MDTTHPDEYGVGGQTSAYVDNVLPKLCEWSSRGQRCALVTLIGVDGNAPRAEGAQMAVSENGQWVGYISGGCLEAAIALEAAGVIMSGKTKLLRYGKGSPYFDIRLPCGSGLDIFIQPILDTALVFNMQERLERREPFALRIDLETGSTRLEPYAQETVSGLPEYGTFSRVYIPPLRCLIIGTSPIAVKLSELAACSGFDIEFYASDPEALPVSLPNVKVFPLLPRARFATDRWTAAVLAFHDHEQELPIFAELLPSQCFFITAIGSRNAHAARKIALEDYGLSNVEIARIQSPAGLVTGLKSAPLVALSILTQVVSAAREQQIVS